MINQNQNQPTNDGKIVRINLDNKASEAIESIMQDLRNETTYINITNNKLVCWIIERFKERYFKNDKDKLIEDHFDKKDYFIDILKNSSNSDNITEKIESALAQIKNERGRSGSGERKSISLEDGLSKSVRGNLKGVRVDKNKSNTTTEKVENSTI